MRWDKMNKEIDFNGIKDKVNEFEAEHIISDIILLGFDGAIRRIKFDVNYNDN